MVILVKNFVISSSFSLNILVISPFSLSLSMKNFRSSKTWEKPIISERSILAALFLDGWQNILALTVPLKWRQESNNILMWSYWWQWEWWWWWYWQWSCWRWYKVDRGLARRSPRAEANNAIACNSTSFNAIPCNAMNYHKKPSNTIWCNALCFSDNFLIILW